MNYILLNFQIILIANVVVAGIQNELSDSFLDTKSPGTLIY